MMPFISFSIYRSNNLVFGLTIFKIENDHVHALINEHISDHYSVRMKN